MLLGRIAGHLELGLFTTANNLSYIPLLAILQPASRPLFASLSSLKHDPARLRRAYQLISVAAITVGLPALVGESLLAKPLIQVLLGRHWLPAAPMMTYLALSIIPSLFALPLGPMVMTLNQAHYFLRRNAFEFCVKLPILIIGGIEFGVFGIIAARVVSEVAVALYCATIARRLIGLGMLRQIMGPWRSYVSTLLMAAGVIFLQNTAASRLFRAAPDHPAHRPHLGRSRHLWRQPDLALAGLWAPCGARTCHLSESRQTGPPAGSESRTPRKRPGLSRAVATPQAQSPLCRLSKKRPLPSPLIRQRK